MSLAIFCWFKSFLTKFFFDFLEKIDLIKFWQDNEKLAQKTLPFFRKNSQKSAGSSGFLKYFFCNLG
jgi:hypothetical protein